MQILSSKLTFFYKFIFIILWIVGFGFGARNVIFIQPQFDGRWLQYVVCWILIALFIFFITGMIKAVTINRDKNRLEVSNFFRTIYVDFSEIEDIDGSSFISPKLIWFTFKHPTVFGSKVSFMPVHRPVRGIGKHPMVMELRKAFNLDIKL